MGGKVVVCGINTSTLPKLTAKQSHDYLVKIKEGDKKAREEFIVGSMRLVLSICKRFNHTKANMDDLFQAGMIGLIKAVDNFDLEFGVSPSSYVVPMIIGEIKRYLKGGNSLRVARSIRDTAYQVLKTRNELEKQDKDSSIESIAIAMNKPIEEVVYSLDAISDTVSLFEPIYNNSGDELLLMDSIGDEKNNDENWTDKVALTSSLKNLNEREKKIIYLRYYEGKTQTEISEEVGISQAQVSRLEKTALKQIKSQIMA